VKKHGIEPHPAEKTYHVHYIDPKTKEYRFVGVFLSQEMAEAAMIRAMEAGNASAPQQMAAGMDDDLERDDSWEADDNHYGVQAREKRNRKKMERARRYQGEMNMFDEDDAQPDLESGPLDKLMDADGNDEDDEEEQKEFGAEEDDEEDLDPVKPESWANRLAEKGQAWYNGLASMFGRGLGSCERWWNRNNDNRIHLDVSENVWRNVHDEPVKVITDPKTVMPLAGKRWQKLQT